MRGKKKVLVGLLATLMLSTVAVGVTGCKPNNPDNSSTSEVQGLTGNYYCSAVDGEYTLSLDGARFELKLGAVTMSGAYTFEGETLALLVDGADGASAMDAKVKDGVITLKYNGATYIFYENVSYTVTYEVNGGTAVAAATVANGKTLSKPADPEKEGCRFIGWYVDADFKTAFAFDSDIVTSDMTLYARYVEYSGEAIEYTVTLVVDGKETATMNTVNGVVYGLPTPQAADKTFAGWWVSDSQDAEKLTYKYVDQVLTQDVKLFAVWADGIQASVNASGVTWSALATGVEYTVKVEDAEGNVLENRKTTALSLEYNFSAEAAGEYKVTVSANDKTATVYYMNKALARVSNFEIVDGNMLVFNAVENAEKYLITVVCGNAAHQHADLDNGNSTNYNFANCAMPEDGIKFVVKAVADGYVASVSETYVYNRKLAAVANVAFNAENGDLTWDAVENATSYKVEITANGATSTQSVATNSISMKAYTGEISVKVTAVAANYNSEAATEYSYTSNKLVAPVATLVGDDLSWNAVAGASSYAVVINGTSYAVNDTTFAIPAEYKTKDTVLKIAVQAVAAEEANSSYASDEMTVNYGVVESVSYADGALTWDLVGGAYSYKVQVNSGAAKVAEQGMALSYVKAGDNTVTLSAYNSEGALLSRKDITVKVYEVSFDVRGGEAVDSLYLATGDAIELPTSSKPGYKFGGWYVSASDNAAKYENVVFDGAEDTTLYAYWEANKYSVTLKLVENVYNSETGSYEKVTKVYDTVEVPYGANYSLPTIASADLQDKSKAFAGWYEDANLSSRMYADRNGDSVNAWNRLGGHTLYAGLVDLFKYSVQEDADGKYYEVVATNEAKNMTEITVPAAYMDPVTGEVLPVMGVATGAFAGFSQLQVLNLPDTLKSIFLSFGGPTATGSALDSCYALREINVYCVDGEHGEHANHETYFSSEDGMLLRHASPQTATLDYGKELVFVPYAKRGVLEIPYGVEHLTTRSLSYMYNLTEIIVPSTVKYLGESVFRGSSNVRRIEFTEASEDVEEVALTIGYNCFLAMTGLEELILPTRVGEINFNMQGGSENSPIIDQYTKLKGITIKGRPTPEDEAAGTYYKDIDGVIVSSDKSTLVYMLASITGEYTIPVEIERIGERAFLNTQISKVIIKDNVYSIEKEAFLATGQWLSGLEAVEFAYEKGELEIGEKAFYGCKKLQEIVLPAQLTKLGANAFGDTEDMQDVTLNAKGDATFAANAFTNDNGEGYVTTLNIGATVPAFEINTVFAGSTLYTFNIEGNPNFKKDNYGVLYNAERTEILYCPYVLAADYVIPETVEVIGTGVFADRASITTMTIPATVKTIKSGAFKNCGLTSLTFAERTDDLTIEANAFEGCVALESVSLPENMTALANNAFKGCINLANVGIPSTLTNLTFANAFAGCDSLANINVTAGNTAFMSKNGILYKGADGIPTEMLFVPSGYTGAVVVPSTVKNIPANMFKGTRNVTSFAFEDNTAPSDLVFGASVFENAKGLKTVTLPTGLQQIPSKMFMGSSVQYIYVPNTVSKVANQAFANCAKLTTIDFEEGETALEFTAASSAANSAFSGTKKLTYIKLPARTAAITNYMFAGSYIEDIDLPEGITSLGNYAFYDSKGLTEFIMPDSITSIGTNAFQACENLKTVVLSKSLTAIPNYAFGGKHKVKSTFSSSDPIPGSGITSIVIPASVTSIGQYAFYGCEDLTSVTFEEGSALTKMDNYAFTNSGLTSFEMPNTVTTAGTYLFAGCTNLKSVKLSEKLTSISNYMFGKQDEVNGARAYTPGFEAAGITTLTIPAKVQTIGNMAFRACEALKTITFAEGCQLTSIGNTAFEMAGITKITLPKNNTTNTTFGTTIFKNCVGLKEAYLPSSIAGLNNCFAGCSLEVLNVESSGDAASDAFEVNTELGFVWNGDHNNIQLYFGTAEEVTIPAGVTDIAASAFAGNTYLKKVKFPATLQKIGESAFSGCTNLATIEAPDNIALNTIGANAFKNSGLTSLKLGQVSSIGDYAFAGCTALTKVDFYGNNTANYMFDGCTALSEVNIYASNFVFRNYVFRKCTALENFAFPTKVNDEGKTVANVASLGTAVFSGSGLTSIDIPAGMPWVTSGTASSGAGVQMFMECANLATVTIADSYSILPYQILYKSGITSLKMPTSLTYIGTNALTGCANLKEVIFPDGIKNVTFGMSTFSGCDLQGELDLSGIETINFVWNSSFNYYEGYTFSANANLTSVKLPASVTVLPQYAFRDCTSLVSVEAPGVTEICTYAFAGCTSLTAEGLGINTKNVNVIGKQAFQKCTSLTYFEVGDGVTTIEQSAFNQSGLTSVKLGAGVTAIADQAFYKTALTSVNIPAQLETIGERAFGECANLAYFYAEPGSNFKVGDYGELYNTNNQLVVFPMAATPADGKVTLMAGTTLNDKYAFYACQNITEVTLSAATTVIPASTFANSSIAVINIPAGVSTINDGAFSGCVNMTSVVLPNSVTTIGASVFAGCTGLSNVTLPKYLATIGKSMFQNCTALTSITLPANVTTISESAFSGSGLTSIEFPAKLATIKEAAFKNTKLTSVVIPATVTALGGTTSSSSGGLGGGLGGGITIKPGIGGTTTTTTGAVAGSVFEGCTELTTVVIEGIFDTFGKNMFKDCTALTSVTLPAGWDKIEEGTFSGCTSLNFEIPATVESVEKDAFAGWTAEQTITISMSVADANKLWGEGWNGNANVVVKA